MPHSSAIATMIHPLQPSGAVDPAQAQRGGYNMPLPLLPMPRHQNHAPGAAGGDISEHDTRCCGQTSQHPSPESLDALADELREPKYGEYYLCQWVNHATPPLSCVDLDLTGILSKVAIKHLAQVDEYEVMQEVQASAPWHLHPAPI